MLASVSAHAVDVSGISMKGEVYFDYNAFDNQSNAMPNVGGAKNDEFRLNTAQILITKETEKISFMTRLAYQPTDIVNNQGATAADQTRSKYDIGTLDQMELFYKVMPNLQIGFGRFLTTMGYESLLKSENVTYGNTIAYQAIVPGYGEGLRAKYVANEMLTATVTSMNKVYDPSLGENNNSKATEASVTGTMGALTWFGGYQFGTNNVAGVRDDVTVTSIWASYKLAENILGAITFDNKTSKLDNESLNWSSSYSAVGSYGIGINNLALRWEHVEGAGSISYAADKIDSITLTDKVTLTENLKLYAEIRNDISNDDAFLDKDGDATKSVLMGTLGAVASF
jgi:hypothetical protein